MHDHGMAHFVTEARYHNMDNKIAIREEELATWPDGKTKERWQELVRINHRDINFSIVSMDQAGMRIRPDGADTDVLLERIAK